MSAYRYNGVKLPALPAWDTDTYPYAQIQYIPYNDGSFISHLRCSTQPFCATASAVTNTAGSAVLVQTYISTYTNFAWGTAYVLEDISLSLDPDSVIWCNVDISDESGAVFLAASEPVPVQSVTIPDFCLNSWLTGFAIGLAGKPLPDLANMEDV